ncbi:hypothetical protein BO71DRAFT_39172 [Aspergillus ellipticus CBS 707.79]|uniref:Uncharacterized protein n=1 Tax=Aspergillus ellipticus CBS 707.79 TaxID=1448320 RepID=A0A319D3B7_9EURO|nr:hypothetical protein BO71DRAFT_39172 [Aspergillus ellipticus CBS 707.79]
MWFFLQGCRRRAGHERGGGFINRTEYEMRLEVQRSPGDVTGQVLKWCWAKEKTTVLSKLYHDGGEQEQLPFLSRPCEISGEEGRADRCPEVRRKWLAWIGQSESQLRWSDLRFLHDAVERTCALQLICTYVLLLGLIDLLIRR